MTKTEELFSGIEAFISESRRIMDEGNLVDTTGLDEQVKTLCEAVLQLSQAERVAHADRMQALLQQLNTLGQEMIAQRDELAAELRGLQSHKKANRAYKIVDASDAYGRRDDSED